MADLTRITGAKRRSVQLWAEGGVILADPETNRAGTGRHRRFSRDEAIIACIVHAFARRQAPIGVLLRISELVRGVLERPLEWQSKAGLFSREDREWMRNYDQLTQRMRSSIELAIKDEEVVYMILRDAGDPSSFPPTFAEEGLPRIVVWPGGGQYVQPEDRDGVALLNTFVERVTSHLDRPGGISEIILLNNYLAGLRNE